MSNHRNHYHNHYEDKKMSAMAKLIIFLFILAAGLTALSKFYLEDVNKKLSGEVKELKAEKETLDSEVGQLEKRDAEVKKSYNDIMEKLNQNKK